MEDVDFGVLDGSETAVTGPFASAWLELYEAGWPVLPVGRPGRPLAKEPPYSDVKCTGRDGSRDLTRGELEELAAGAWGRCNIAARMPEGVLGLDVDLYRGGGETLAELEARLGPLPASGRIVGRPDGSYKVFYQVPIGWESVGSVGGIDCLQRHHRFAVCPPSWNPKGGMEYEWQPSGRVPRVAELPVLPAAWLAELARKKPVRPKLTVLSGGAAAAGGGGALEGSGAEWLAGLLDEAELLPCSTVALAQERWAGAITGRDGARYDNMVHAQFELASLWSEGHRGVGTALEDLKTVYREEVSGERGGWEAEWSRALDGLAAFLDGREREPECTCLSEEELEEMMALWAARGTHPAPEEPEPVAAVVVSERPADDRYVPFADPAWWEKPDPEPLIPHLIREGDAVTVYAAAGQGKSLLMQDAVTGLSVRGECWGEALPGGRRPVLYLDHENSESEVRRRLEAQGLGPLGVDWSLLHYSLLGLWKPLDTLEGAAQLCREVDRLGVRLVVIDTLSKVTRGEENSNDTFSALHRFTLTALKRGGVAVLLLDHTGKDVERGARGASAKSQNVDAVFRLSATKDGRFVSLAVEKNRSGLYAGLEFVRDPVTGLHRPAGALAAAAARAIEEEEEIERLIMFLDADGIPPDAGRSVIRKYLRESRPEWKYSNRMLGEVTRRRKEAAGS